MSAIMLPGPIAWGTTAGENTIGRSSPLPWTRGCSDRRQRNLGVTDKNWSVITA